MKVTARAVDEAGNVGERVGPLEIILDSLGPQLTLEQTGNLLYGKATDGSGVASLEISLNGGATYAPLAVDGEGAWAFDQDDWSGQMTVDVAILRAKDIYGNTNRLLAPYARALSLTRKFYLPLTMRGAVMEAAATEATPITETAPITGTAEVTDTHEITGTTEVTEIIPDSEATETTETPETPDSQATDADETADDAPKAPWQIVFLPVITRAD